MLGNRNECGFARNLAPHFLYLYIRPRFAANGGIMTGTGLQKLAFFMLLALILYVTITGGK